MSQFIDDETPLPAPFTPAKEPGFGTERIPRIRLAPALGEEESLDAAALYPRWRIESPCDNVDDFARLHTPYFDGHSIFIFTADVPRAEQRVACEIALATGERILGAIADVTEAHHDSEGPYGKAGIRLRLLSVDADSAPLLEELGERTESETARATVQMWAMARSSLSGGAAGPVGGTLPAPGARATAGERPSSTKLMHALPRPSTEPGAGVVSHATTKMSRVELAELLGSGAGDVPEWSELLVCRLAVAVAGEREASDEAPPDHRTTRRKVISELGVETPSSELTTRRMKPLPQPEGRLQPLRGRPELMWIAAGIAVVMVLVIALLAG